MRATVVIISKNRRDDLRKAVQSAVEQTAKPQVVVIDDGSSDGTAEMVRTEFPQVVFHREKISRGYIVQRNRAADLSSGELIFSIDDDAAFSTPFVVEQTVSDFEQPRIGAVAIPFINVNRENTLFQRSPVDNEIFVTHDFIGTAHAVRRDLFLQLGGYRPFLFHQGEEQDFCARLLEKGYVVRMGRADPILHFESSNRNFERLDLFGRRNDILFVWYNAPLIYLPIQMIGTTLRGLIMGFRLGRPVRMIRGIAMGYASCLRDWSGRKPVSMKTFGLMRQLKHKPAKLGEIEKNLNAL